MKLTLISKLSSSMVKKKKKVSKAKTDSWDGVFGIMKDVSEIVLPLRTS